jgi:hypothetical protein
MSLKEFNAEIDVCMGGRVAEAISMFFLSIVVGICLAHR